MCLVLLSGLRTMRDYILYHEKINQTGIFVQMYVSNVGAVLNHANETIVLLLTVCVCVCVCVYFVSVSVPVDRNVSLYLKKKSVYSEVWKKKSLPIQLPKSCCAFVMNLFFPRGDWNGGLNDTNIA